MTVTAVVVSEPARSALAATHEPAWVRRSLIAGALLFLALFGPFALKVTAAGPEHDQV